MGSGHPHLYAQTVPSQVHLPDTTLPSAPAPTSETQQKSDLADIPRATLLAPEKKQEPISWDADKESKHEDIYTLSGNVIVYYGDHTLYADTITYDASTSEMNVDGHVKLIGGPNHEHLEASRGTYNLKDGTGRFYDVSGSIQIASVAPITPSTAAKNVVSTSQAPTRQSYVTSNPFLFQGRMVVKTGPTDYVVYDGSVTSCLLPHPDWQLFSHKFTVTDGVAHAGSSTFRLLGIPVLFLPYVTHPTDTEQRQSGILIPVFGYSSASNNTGSKGLTIGEQIYLVINRSTDITVGTIYYSLRGFSENGTIRYKGVGDNFITGHFTALQDRGFYVPTQVGVDKVTGNPIIKNIYTNQGGQDLTFGFRRQLDQNTRVVGDAEYLSSYIFREAFTETFNQAVSSDIDSILYLTREDNGYAMDIRGDRYQGQKVVPVRGNPGLEVKVFHAPSLDFSGIDRRLGNSPFFFGFAASAAGLKRIQPNFVSSGIIERVDLRPELSLPLAFDGWHTLSSVAVRETAYTRSRVAPYGNGAIPVELTTPINRADLDLDVDIRPPVIERDFKVPEKWHWLLGDEVRHTIEPDIHYRNVHGIDNFLAVLRFDDVDLASDTDELRYGVTQHLYFRPRQQKARPGCPVKPSRPIDSAKSDAAPTTDTQTEADKLAELETFTAAQKPTSDANGIPDASAQAPDLPTRTHVARHADPCATTLPAQQQEWFSWELKQKTFFAQNFGGAVINGRRNIFESTLNLSGIAFLTEARAISPVISRMRFRTSSHTDVEWDFDYDTGAKKFNSSNTFLDVHEGSWFGGFSYARLNAPGRFYTPQISTVTNTITGLTTSATSKFSQMRLLVGYGTPSKSGLSIAGGAGIDLNAGSSQYVTIQSGYNWNCCGLSIEYRQYNLGPVRDEGAYRFNFTLANIGSAGNLRRAEALF
jgi:LPS-assembly protein